MAIYSSVDAVKSGVPLGGIGAGKWEILPNGIFNAANFMNNWDAPLAGNALYPGILGYHFGIFYEPHSFADRHARRNAVLLQTVPVLDIPTVRSIAYEGVFPKAVLRYDTAQLGLEVSLELWSPWRPGVADDSGFPVCHGTFSVKNARKVPVKTGILFIGRNICGDWCVGRYNQIVEKPGQLDLVFTNKDPKKIDTRSGQIRFCFEKDPWQLSFIESWNAVSKNFRFGPQEIDLRAWGSFASQGKLPNSKAARPVRAQGENQELCGAVCATSPLEPLETKTWSWTMAWHFPHHPFGHHYAVKFKDSEKVAETAVSARRSSKTRIGRFHDLVFSFPFPKWFNDALIANLSPFFSSSLYLKDKRFAFYEAPVICPLLGTLDVGYYGSIPLAYFFPDLESSQMDQFSRAQRSDGYMPHDLGRHRVDMPSDGTTFHKWKDLNPKYILMIYRDFLWSGDRSFLKRSYPHVKRALAWSLAHDKDGNGLPDHEGADQTFDLWEFYGANSYTAGIFLGALLACCQMAKLMGDTAFLRECQKRLIQGKRSFEMELWNGKYFGQKCQLSQLHGQWYASLLGLGYIVDAKKIRKALAYILEKNTKPSSFGMVNSVYEDGRLDISNDHSRNVWAGMNYAFLSHCLMEGFPLKNLLKEAYKIWDNVSRSQQNIWNQADTVNSSTGSFVFGDAYYRNMAIWAIPIAFAKSNNKAKVILNALKSL